ncbi:hypothetical protein Droror1_Dr00027210 [Drosera rotundifolia]
MMANLLNVDAKDVLKTAITSLEIQLQEAKTTKQNHRTKLDEKMEGLRVLKEETKELTKGRELLREKIKALLNENNSLKLVVAKCKQAFEKMKKKEDLLGMELYEKKFLVKGLQSELHQINMVQQQKQELEKKTEEIQILIQNQRQQQKAKRLVYEEKKKKRRRRIRGNQKGA